MLTRRSFLLSAIGAIAGCVERKSDPQSRPGGLIPGKDDTGLLQTALNEGGHIVLQTGKRYRVSAPSGVRAALLVRSDTFIDLSGATLELAPSQRCALIGKEGKGRIRNVKIANGTIVGNGTWQPTDYRREIGITPTLYLTDCDSLELHNLSMRDTYMYAVYARGDDGVVENISVEGAVGGGIHLDGARWQIDNITVRDVTYFERVDCQGNPFIVCLQDSQIGRIRCDNYGFGVKLQDGCEDVMVESIEAIAGPNNYLHPDYLVKIQGKKERNMEWRNRNIRIGSITSRNGPCSGLYIYCSERVEIGSYFGEKNGQSRPVNTKNGADVLIIDSDHIRFDRLRAGGFPRYGLWLHDRTGRVVANQVEMRGVETGEGNTVVVRSGVAVLGGVAITSPGGRI